MEAKLAKRLELLERPVEIRRFDVLAFDVLADDIANAAAREARSADTFVALRPEGSSTPLDLSLPGLVGRPGNPSDAGDTGSPAFAGDDGNLFQHERDPL
jgi:hypothetical protein